MPETNTHTTQTRSVPKVSVLIVSYNTRDMTIACIESVKHHTTLPNEIIVVDNNSPDGSAMAIRKSHPDMKLIASDDNLGFARANNHASQHAQGEFLLLLNPDTLLIDDAIDSIVSFAERNPDAGIWGGRTLYADRSLNPTSCWRSMSLRSIVFQMLGLTSIFPRSEFLNRESYGRWQRDTPRHVDIVTGCFLLIRRDFWERLGGFDPRYFMYAEEADLCIRASKRGAAPMITPEATIVHYESASDPIRWEKTVKVLRGKCTLIRTHWSPARKFLGLRLLSASPLVRFLLYRVASVLPGRKSARDKADIWYKVWAHRGEWLPGYPPYAAPQRGSGGEPS